jgi:hypothetical protein
LDVELIDTFFGVILTLLFEDFLPGISLTVSLEKDKEKGDCFLISNESERKSNEEFMFNIKYWIKRSDMDLKVSINNAEQQILAVKLMKRLEKIKAICDQRISPVKK